MHFYMKLKQGVFPYLWLKSIVGFNPKTNYAQCLLGDFETGIVPFGNGMKKGYVFQGEITRKAPYYVLCGIPMVGGLERALYILFSRSPGANITYEDTRASVIITDAEQFDLPPLTHEEMRSSPWGIYAPDYISPCYRVGWHFLMNSVQPRFDI